MLETARAALAERGIAADLVELEVKGIPKILERHGLVFEDLGLEGCTLFYRRREADMPLVEMPDDADERRQEKVRAGRQKMLAKAMEKYRFRFEPLCRARRPARRGRAAGRAALPPHGDRERPRRADRTRPSNGAAATRSARSAASRAEIPGIPMKGELFAFSDWDLGRLAGYPSVFSAGNVVTGKGNIVASRKHAREVSSAVIEAFLGLGETGHAGEEALADELAAGARESGARSRTRSRASRRIAPRGAGGAARARAQAPAGGRLRRRLPRLGRIGLGARQAIRLRAGRARGALPGGPPGCFRIGVTTGYEIPVDEVAQIVPGVTTKTEVLRWFGAPSQYTDGEILARMFDAGEVVAEDLVALPFADVLVYEIIEGQTRDPDHDPLQLGSRRPRPAIGSWCSSTSATGCSTTASPASASCQSRRTSRSTTGGAAERAAVSARRRMVGPARGRERPRWRSPRVHDRPRLRRQRRCAPIR